MTPLQIVSNPRLLDQVVDVMRERNLFDDYHLVPIRNLHNSDVMEMHCLLDWTILEHMEDERLAADYGLERIKETDDFATPHDLSSPGLADHLYAIRATRR